jgi:hypothetical protein
VILGAAIIFAVWRALGIASTSITLFLIASGAVAIQPRKWRNAYLLSLGALYVPYPVMAVHTSLYVSCSHCIESACLLLPMGPGMLPWELGSRGMSQGGLDKVTRSMGAFAVSAVTVAVLTAIVQACSIRWRVAVLVAVIAGGGFAAYGLLMLIQA